MPQQDSQVGDNWVEEVQRQGAIVLPFSGGKFLAFDVRRPWRALLVPEGANDVSSQLATMELRPEVAAFDTPRQRCEITYVGQWPPSREAMNAILDASAQYGPRSTRVKVYFTDDRVDLVQGLIHFGGPDGRCTVEFHGPMPELSEEDIAHLVSRGATLTLTAGWPLGNDPDRKRIREACELGLRLPVEWFVHRDNVDSVLQDADKLLQVTYHSGLAIQPVCAHPQFTVNDVEYLPDADRYVELLTQGYRQFRHHDDVFEPLRSLVGVLQDGGWSETLDEPLPVRIRLDESGAIRKYRQLPWPTAGDGMTGNALLPTVSETCNSCRWLNVCGGCEAVDERAFQVVCDYRMLFLEFFVRQMHQGLESLESSEP